MRLVGIHQPHYLPWLRYIEKIARSDVFILLDSVQYSKNGWQNRNKIKGPDGALTLTVPVHATLDGTIADIAIDNRSRWQKKHWRTLQQHYRGTPFFQDYEAAIARFYLEPWTSLTELNEAMLQFFLRALQIDTPIHRASDLNVDGEATDRIVNLVRAVDGDAYYSGAYALDVYLDADALSEAGIQLRLQEWSAPVYPQPYPPFVGDLSILDLLMNTGPEARNLLV